MTFPFPLPTNIAEAAQELNGAVQNFVSSVVVPIGEDAVQDNILTAAIGTANNIQAIVPCAVGLGIKLAGEAAESA